MRLFALLLLLPAALVAGQARYARMGEFQGTVEVQLQASEAWMAAERNLPLVESTWVRSGPASRAEIELDEGSAWRLGPNSQAGIADYLRLATGQRVTLLTLDRGLAYFAGGTEGRDSLILTVPGAQVTVTRGARVRLEAADQWSHIAVLAGVVRFSSPAAELDLREGQTASVEPAHPARFFLNREIAPMELDRWSDGRDRALAGSVSAAHVAERFGLVDLDTAGAWVQTEDLGPVWKPKAQQGWIPFQNGRWLWYDGLGYTWVSAEDWGWLPYHYGRWLRKANLGWIWAPAPNAVFKPGDVYWLRGGGAAGWGPLAPGEQWTPGAPDAPLPQQFLDANTTYASFQQDAAAIDPAGFTARPKEPLRTMAFAAALPSPAFVASKLDAQRPFVSGAPGGITPFVEGTTFESAAVGGASQAPVVVITQPAATPAPEQVPVPYPVPVAMPPAVVVLTQPANPPEPPAPKAAPKPAPASASSIHPAARRLPAASTTAGTYPPSRRNSRRSEEDRAANVVAQDIAGHNYSKARADLDAWSHEFPDSERKPERLYDYLQAYNGLNQPAKVVDTGAQLLDNLGAAFPDPMQVVTVLYLTAVSYHKLSNPTRAQALVGRAAGADLLAFLPACFAPANRPAATSEHDWAKARSDLEVLAKQTIAAAEKRTAP
jgi:Family of unknown function (DUF6600)/FecR protein